MKLKWNFPNILVVIRILIAVVIFGFLTFFSLQDQVMNNNQIQNIWIIYLCLSLFIIASLTDYVDGYYAKKNNQITDFGKLFDPLADKILINSILIFFTVFGWIPVWATVLFISRDLLVDGLRMHLATQGKVVSAGIFGKWKTFFQMIGLIVLFFPMTHHVGINNSFSFTTLGWQSLWLSPIFIALFFSLFSGVKYYKDGLCLKG
ncbi:MAG: CDP-diacylglycerol--glycerol-3-phosphate 3-phosphatidyltransferase [Mycoplasmataceae bacterium]|nr:CDP-diacylglycerol--glycerol-3-phosphate 3-phosphatidyltransferase [Mycoplasmataceae bacterium]